MNTDKKSMDRARAHAQRCQDQNMAAAVDRVRALLARDADHFQLLNRLLHLDNTDAAAFIEQLDTIERRELLLDVVVFARIGLSEATFRMEAKFGGGGA